jgi:hypothetical protein
MSTTMIEGVDVDRALLDECHRIAARLDTFMPELRELLAVAAAALVKVEIGLMKPPRELRDGGYERLMETSGIGRLYKIMLELHQACDFDAVILADRAYLAATHGPE